MESPFVKVIIEDIDGTVEVESKFVTDNPDWYTFDTVFTVDGVAYYVYKINTMI